MQGATGISDEEIAKAKEDADKFSKADEERAELVTVKNKLEQTIYQVEKTMEEQKDNIEEDMKKKLDELLQE
ncbi:Hsp70 family protein [bacterium]|nr:Hsp70 family protein [bacterium]